MASLIKKKKANTIYYYVVESARVDGKPRIVHQTYLGTAESVARLAQDRSAPIPLSATTVDFGLPGALWLAAEKSGVFALLHSLWPKPRSGPSPAHYLLLAAIHRICQPGPKTEVADWYRASILSSLWGFAPERFTSQAFWDCFDTIATGESLPAGKRDELEEAQLRLLGVWKEKQLVTHRLLAYDTTNFYTYIASNNERNSLAQRGHNKQGRHNLRQVGLSYVLDGDNGISLCHHLYRGNMADAEQFPEALQRIVTLLERNQIAADTVTLVLDKGGSTSGSATTATARNFQRRGKNASQYASGIPTASRIKVVQAASRMLSQMASQSIIDSPAHRNRISSGCPAPRRSPETRGTPAYLPTLSREGRPARSGDRRPAASPNTAPCRGRPAPAPARAPRSRRPPRRFPRTRTSARYLRRGPVCAPDRANVGV